MDTQGKTILYYPTIDIPKESWLLQALTYWDNVASIVPRSYDDWRDEEVVRRYSKDIQYLYDKSVFKPFNPDTLILSSNELFNEFIKEFEQKIKSKSFRELLVGQKDILPSTPIYKQKLTDSVFRKLKTLGLAREIPGNTRESYFCYYFDKKTALFYMSLLAKYLAKAEGNTVVGTDNRNFSEFNNLPIKESDSALVLSTRLQNLLVVPANGTSVKKILNFKNKYNEQLNEFRSQFENFELNLKAISDRREIESKIRGFKEQIEKDVIKLEKSMRRSKITTILGSFQAFIKPNSPTLIGAAAVVADKATSLSTIPIEYTIAGAGIAGLIEVGMHLIKEDKEKAKSLETPFSYIYLAKRKLKADFSR